MSDGLTVIAAGLIVVLCIMASMLILIEVILKLDQMLKRRAERGSGPAQEAQATPAPDPGASRKKDEVIAAIGLALQRHLAGAGLRSAATQAGPGPTPWASSGRLGIMAGRQRVTSHRS
jgi:hypothetical protein